MVLSLFEYESGDSDTYTIIEPISRCADQDGPVVRVC
jgi:hypothetical protein